MAAQEEQMIDFDAPDYDLNFTEVDEQDELNAIAEQEAALADLADLGSDEPLTLDDVTPDAANTDDSDDGLEVMDPDGFDIGDVEQTDPVAGRENTYFVCLGYLDGNNFFLSRKSGQIFEISPGRMTQNSLLHMAPLDWWRTHFPRRGGEVDWTAAVDTLIVNTYKAGVWDPRMNCRQGARWDGGTVVFNSGTTLYVDGQGTLPLDEFRGESVYSIGPRSRMPDVITPFTEDCSEPRELLEIIRQLDWHSDRKELSIIALYGWLAISVMCGMLYWRPHLWLDGPRGSGKSWVVTNIVNKVLGDYVINAVSNTSEPGLRNMLNSRAVPVILDEAEAVGMEAKKRMQAIIQLARHTATHTKAQVAQGVAGGGASRAYSVATSFLMTSIVPQLAEAADNSRFCRIKLASGRKHQGFKDDIEVPAKRLLNDDFSDRWIGRMITRAKDYEETYEHMVHGLSLLGLERRLADVYGSFATGCWLMLRDGTPADEREAAAFISSEFNVLEQMLDSSQEISEDKDHTRLFSAIMSHEMRLDSGNMGAQLESLGTLLEIACGFQGEEDAITSQRAALETLRKYGIRPAIDTKIIKAGEDPATTILIHKKANPMHRILENTPYSENYADVMLQADDVKNGPPTRFGAGLGNARTIIVPIEHFGIGTDYE